mmetsp:Transcript_11326/g.42462  ORF Transcript_11326/g.42462 Transcript_11326/m.42462 type:complete len:374 (-) Transcript_11326:48-1169(-)
MSPRSTTSKPLLICTAPFRFLPQSAITSHFQILQIPERFATDVGYLRETLREVLKGSSNTLRSSADSPYHSAAGLYCGMGGWSNLTTSNFFDPLSDLFAEQKNGTAPMLKIIANHGVGYDNIDASAAANKGIIVTNTPDVVSAATSEIALSLILQCSRKLGQQEKSLREGKWVRRLLYGNALGGKVLGIVGMGSIGREVAKRAKAFGMNIMYHQRHRLPQEFEQEHDMQYAETLHDLLKRSDMVSLHCPLTENTRHLISEKEFECMKKSAYIINTSRGPVIDEKAMLNALREGRIAGAGLDVHEYEPQVTADFLDLENVVLLPHVGTHTVETRHDMEALCLENLKKVLVEGRAPVTPVKECAHIKVARSRDEM